MPPATRRAISALLLLALLLTAPPPPSAAQSGAALLASTPGTIEITLPLGATLETTIALRNNAAESITPQLFEAFPPAAQRLAPAQARAALPRQGTRIDPLLQSALAASPDGQADFLVFLADQADLSPAYTLAGWSARGEFVYRTLREHAEATQGALRAAVAARGMPSTSLWIVNALAVRGDAADVAALAGRAEVAELRATRTAALETIPAQVVSPTCSPDSANSCWNIARVGATRTWAEFGVAGEGITVANIDSGVRFDHPALIGHYRGNSGGAIDHNYHWYDLFGASPTPVDSGNHGTHTMGTMVARGSSPSEPAVGVAPGARWIAVRACGPRECNEVDLIRAAQWILAPTDLAGANPRPDLRPNVVNNSWTSGTDTDWYAGYTAAWRAAGIYPVFAAGNTGNTSGCATIQSPGDYADVTAVGAVDSLDRITSFSSVGPAPGGRLKPDLTAPGNGVWSTVADPGRLYGSSSGTSMATPHVAGAAALVMAANPTLIGDYDAVYATLTGAAAPLSGDERFLGPTHSACAPTAVPNNIYGHGRLDAYAAVARAHVDVPWLGLPEQGLPQLAPGAEAGIRVTLDARRVPGPGSYQARILVHGPSLSAPPLTVPVTITIPADNSHATIAGRVTRANDGMPVLATITVAGGVATRTDDQGRYTISLPPAVTPYTLTADARDFVARPATVTLGAGARVTLDFALDPDMPRLAVDTGGRSMALAFAERATIELPIANVGSRTLTYTASLPPDLFGVWRSDEADGPPAAWTDPPADAVTIPLPDDGASGPIPIGFGFHYLDAAYEQLYVTSNGVISFSPLPTDNQPFARTCLPLPETLGPAIAPLRVDLDPSRPGARVSYARAEGGLLVTWEQVPLYNDPDQRLSFQALLLPGGRISLRYRTVGVLQPGEAASFGLQYQLRQSQVLGCRSNLGLSDGLTIELRPQPTPQLWLSLDPPVGQVAPGATGTLQLRSRWSPPQVGGWPMSATVVIQSNDPLRPAAHVTVRLTTTAAPYRTIFPWVPVSRARP